MWSQEAQVAFNKLKVALSTALVLALPDFEIEIEIDASKSGIGEVLMQIGHPLAFISKTLGPKWQKLSVYEKRTSSCCLCCEKVVPICD